MKFSAVLIFSGLWLLAVYSPVTHWVWGGGWLGQINIVTSIEEAIGIVTNIEPCDLCGYPARLDHGTCEVCKKQYMSDEYIKS